MSLDKTRNNVYRRPHPQGKAWPNYAPVDADKLALDRFRFTMSITLISATPSPFARMNRIALHEKGIPFELKNVRRILMTSEQDIGADRRCSW